MAMKIIMLTDDDGWRWEPQVMCDVCGEQIDNARLGMFAWDWKEGEEEADVYFAHKGPARPCILALNKRLGYMCDWELADLPAYLANNMGVDLKKPRPYHSLKGQE